MMEVTALSKLEEEPVTKNVVNAHVERKLIKNGSIKFQTNDVEEANRFVQSAVKKYGGYVSRETNDNSEGKKGYDLTTRVPAKNYDSLVTYILNNANIKNLDEKSTEIEDVTTDYIDVETQLKIKKGSEQKLMDLLKQAKNLRDVLAVQKQLTDLQSEIESMEGRLKYLSDQISYSTLSVSFYSKQAHSEKFFGDFWDAIKNGWQVFLSVLTFMANLWVLILVTILCIWGFRSYRKRRKLKKAKAEPKQPGGSDE